MTRRLSPRKTGDRDFGQQKNEAQTDKPLELLSITHATRLANFRAPRPAKWSWQRRGNAAGSWPGRQIGPALGDRLEKILVQARDDLAPWYSRKARSPASVVRGIRLPAIASPKPRVKILTPLPAALAASRTASGS